MPTPVITYRSSKTCPHADCFNSERESTTQQAALLSHPYSSTLPLPPARETSQSSQSTLPSIYARKVAVIRTQEKVANDVRKSSLTLSDFYVRCSSPFV